MMLYFHKKTLLVSLSISSLTVATAAPLAPSAAIERDMAREYETRAWTPVEEVLSGQLDRKRGFGRDLDVEYVTEGFVNRLSRAPEPGVHPRVIMSPSDVDELRRLLALGDDAPAFFRSQMARLEALSRKENPGVSQAPWLGPSTELAQKALYALITEDHRIGREAVTALMQRAETMEKLIVAFDAEWGESGHNDMVYSAISSHSMGLGMAYDYAYAFMTDDERDYVRSIIAKATKDRYTSFMDQPDHFLITNHLAFAMNWWLELLAIEGEPGFDARAALVGLHKVEAYINAVISKRGFPFEGVKPSISPYAFLAAQRRGHRKAVQSDHLHNYTLNVLNGLYWKQDDDDPTRGSWYARRPHLAADGDEMSIYPAPFLKYFYPDDILVDTAWEATGGGVRHANVDLSLVLGECVYHALGWQADNPELPAAVREQVPLTWVDSERGMMRTRVGWNPDDLMLRFEARANYYSAGHEGTETFALDLVADGVDWTYYPGRYQDSRLHGTPQIDGRGPTRWQPIGANILAVHDTPEATVFVADATDEYNWWKFEKTSMLWHPDIDISNTWLKNNGWLTRRNQEVPFLPGLRWYYEGFGHPEYGNWHGETRGLEWYYLEDRSIDLAMRTVHLARGRFPYILILDDLRMDEEPHRYEVALKLQAEIEQQDGANIILTRGQGTERLLVRVLHTAAPYEAKLVDRGDSRNPDYRRLEISTTAVEPEFRILVYPFRLGEPLPETAWSPDGQTLAVKLPGQEDVYRFAETDRGRTVYAMSRNQALVVDVDARPAAPQLADRELWMGGQAGYGGHETALPEELLPTVLPFADKMEVNLTSLTPGTVIRFTSDGSDPSDKSGLYGGPITLDKTTTLKARSFGGADWPGMVNVSDVFTMTFEKRAPAPAGKTEPEALQPGLLCELYEVYQTIYDDETGYFTGGKRMLPVDNPGGAEIDVRRPLLRTVVEGLEPPRADPVGPTRRMTTGYYRYRGYLNVPETGTYRFRLHSPGPLRMRIGGQTVIENTGVYYNAQRDRYGAATLQSGLQPFELVVADPDLFRGGMSPALSPALDMVKPGGNAFVPVDADAFRCEAPGIIAKAVNIGSATVSFAPPSEGAEQRYTLARREMVDWPVSQEWPTAASPVANAPLTLAQPGHYVISVAEFKDGEAVTPVVQKRIAVLPVHEAVAVDGAAAGLVQRLYERSPDPASDFDALALSELELTGREPLQASITPNPSGAANSSDKPLVVFSGYFKAPVDGFYAFDLEDSTPVEARYVRSGINRLMLDGQTVVDSRLAGPEPMNGIYLKAGLHPVRIDLVDGKIEWRVRLPDGDDLVAVDSSLLFHESQEKGFSK
jgi:hypothetical protein